MTSSYGIRPNQNNERAPPTRSSSAPTPSEGGRDLDLARFDHELGFQLLVHGRQAVDVFHSEVGPFSHQRDLLQDGLVQLRMQVESVELDRRCQLVGPRVPRYGRALLGRRPSARPPTGSGGSVFSPSVSSTMTAGAKAPRGRSPVRRGRLPRAGLRRDEVQRRHHSSAERRRALRLQAVDGGVQRPAIVGRRLHNQAALSEGYDADPGATGPPLNEGLCGELRSFHPRGLDVIGRHTGRHVQRQHYRALHAGATAASAPVGPKPAPGR